MQVCVKNLIVLLLLAALFSDHSSHPMLSNCFSKVTYLRQGEVRTGL